jgi:hypothetical protein
MPKTPLQTHEVNGVTFSTYPCKFEDCCDKYNPAYTLFDNRNQEYLNRCTHGGGVGCPRWRHLTDQEIGLCDVLPNRSWSGKRGMRHV